MDKDNLLIELIHGLDKKIDRIEKQVDEITAMKNRLIGICSCISAGLVVIIEVLRKVF